MGKIKKLKFIDLVCKLCGFLDKWENLIYVEQEMIEWIISVYCCWGFEGFDMGVFEFVDVFGKFLFDDDCLNVGVFVL